MLDNTFLIIDLKVTTRKFSIGPFVLFGLLIDARNPVALSLSRRSALKVYYKTAFSFKYFNDSIH